MSNSEFNISFKEYGLDFQDRFSIIENYMDKIKLGFFESEIDENNFLMKRPIQFEGEVKIEIPELSGFEFIIGNENSLLNYDVCIDLINFKVIINNLNGKISFPRSLFQPIIEEGGKYKVDPEEFVEINFTTNFEFDENFNITTDDLNNLQIPPMMIGNTGIIIEANPVSLILSSNQALEENLPEDWKGIKFGSSDSIHIHLPFDLNIDQSNFSFSTLVIGSGGLSGTISYNESCSGTFFGFDFKLNLFEVTFHQNTIVNSIIQGEIKIPFFDKWLKVDIGLSQDGNYTITFININEQGYVEFPVLDILNVRFESIEFEKDNDQLFILLNGSIKIDYDAFSDLDWLEIKSLRIDSHGNVHIKGGWLALPNQMSFSFYGFIVEVTKMRFGTDSNNRWLGLDAGIKFSEWLPLCTNIEGLLFKWDTSGHKSVEFSGIGISFQILDVIGFNGSVGFVFNENCFKGGVKFEIIPLNIGFNAQVIIDKDEHGYNILYIFLEGRFPVGIPLYSTGLSIYGFSGLYGQNIKPNKTENQSWIDWKNQPGGIGHIEKWISDPGNHAFGAGCLIGTSLDNGYSFNANVLLMLLIPGPIILIQGKADFLSKMDWNGGKFDTLAVFDCRAGNFLFNVHAGYSLPSSNGWILDIEGDAEAFFDFYNPLKWHLYLGQNKPTNKRLRARFLDLFEANCYFMLGNYDIDGSKFGIATGAMLGYDRKWKYGPIKIGLKAWIEGNGYISWIPPQLGGDLWLEGGVDISVFGFGFGLSIGAGVAASTPNPYHIRAELRIKINLPWPLPDPKVKVVLEWKKTRKPTFKNPLECMGIEHLKVTEKLQLINNITDKYEEYNVPKVPMDARPTLIFSNKVFDKEAIGANRTPRLWDCIEPEYIPPTKPEHGIQYEAKYILSEVKLERQSKTGRWNLVDRDWGNVFGNWLAEINFPSDSVETFIDIMENLAPSMTKLMLFVDTPFLFSQGQLSDEYYRNIIENYRSPCEDLGTIEKEFITFDNVPLDQEIYYLHESNKYFIFQGLYDDYSFLYYRPLRIRKSGTYESEGVSQGCILPSDINIEEEKGHLNILFHSGAKDIEIFVHLGTPGVVISGTSEFNIKAFYQDGHEWNSGSLSVNNYVIPQEGEITERLEIWGSFSELLKVSYTPYNKVRLYEEYNESKEQMINLFKERYWQNKILSPYKNYRLIVKTQVQYEDGESGQENFIEYAYFRTGGPPGLDIYRNFNELNSLTHYIARTIPQTDPIRPHRPYRAYDVGMEFNESYIDQMYAMAKAPLHIQLFDNNNNPLNIKIRNKWSESVTTYESYYTRVWKEMLSECIELKETEEKNELRTIEKDYVLEPEMFYMAKLLAKRVDSLEENLGIPIFYFNFTSSKFSTFIHHIHSFRDALWDFNKMFNNGNQTEINDDNLRILEEIISEYNNNRSKNTYNTLFNDIFNLGYLELSNNLEITLLNDLCYGFFLQSPEPLDWPRIDFKAYYTEMNIISNPKINPALGKLKLIDVFKEQNDTFIIEEWVDVLLQETLNPSGYIIENTITDGNYSQFTFYFQFKDEKVWPAGTIFRIHQIPNVSSIPDDPLPSYPERVHRYIIIETEDLHSGESNKPDVFDAEIEEKTPDIEITPPRHRPDEKVPDDNSSYRDNIRIFKRKITNEIKKQIFTIKPTSTSKPLKKPEKDLSFLKREERTSETNVSPSVPMLKDQLKFPEGSDSEIQKGELSKDLFKLYETIPRIKPEFKLIDHFRIFDLDNNLIHQKIFLSESNFTEFETSIIIPNEDKTSAFIFLPLNNSIIRAMPPEKYIRFEFVYNRFKNEKSIVLKRAGSSDPESTYIEFSIPPQLPFSNDN